MNYYVIADTHFGHEMLRRKDYCDRPADADERMLKNIGNIVTKNDILIHLGDFCIGHDEGWHTSFWRFVKPFKAWLIRGNHDKKTPTWYMKRGWDIISDGLVLNIFGKQILLSHEPQNISRFDIINVHGHCHNPTRSQWNDDHHRLVKMEHSYMPVNLRRVVGA